MKSVKLLFVLCVSVFLLSGCVKLWQDTIEIKTYMVLVERDGDPVAVPLASKLRIDDVYVLPPYNVRSLIIRENDVKFSTSYYSELLMSPSENFRNGFYTWLADSGMFEDISLNDRKGMSHRLVATVLDFYADKAAKQVVLKIKVSLLDESGGDVNVLLYEDYEQRINLPAEGAEDLLRGYSQAFTAILTQFEKDALAVLQK